MNGLMKMSAFLLVVAVSATGCVVDSEPQDELDEIAATEQGANVEIGVNDWVEVDSDLEQEPMFESEVARDRFYSTMIVEADEERFAEKPPFVVDHDGGSPSPTRGDLDGE